MRKFSSYLISIFLITLFSTSVYAAQNEVCEPLKADGVTKGLYGLCIAYHASGANSQVLLDNYNKKKTSSDPVMPGTDDNPPTLSCACWNTLTAEDIGANPEMPANFCALSEAIDFIYYGGITEGQFEQLIVSEGYCQYSNTGTDDEIEISTLTSLQEDECRYEILGVAMRDFQEIGCVVPE